MAETARFDIAIVGAGPAGLIAARTLSVTPTPPSVILIDRKKTWEHPIACAEAIGRESLGLSVSPKPSWIRRRITCASFHAPGGPVASYRDESGGYIIDRAAMQRDLAAECEQNGVHCRFDQTVVSISRPGGDRRRMVHLHSGERVSARVVIDASGPLSRFGKEERVAIKPYDLEPAWFAHVENVDVPQDTCSIYASETLAPGGYGWVFPREDGAANIGVLVGRPFVKKVRIRESLDAFLHKHFPQGKPRAFYAGSIPCGYRRSTMAVDGLLKAGDAASTVNPISRAGIAEAMICGRLAAQCAVQMAEASSAKHIERICKCYEKGWYAARGKKHAKLLKVKPLLAAVPDGDFDRGAAAYAHLPEEKRTVFNIFAITVKRFPRLVWALRHLL